MDPPRTGEEPAPKSLRERVLVVEDELIIGEIAAEVLTDAGYEVFTAASAEEAEIILRECQWMFCSPTSIWAVRTALN